MTTTKGTLKVQAGGKGIGFASVLTIVFIVLKLTKTIAWSWWWVLAPLWVSGGVVVAAIIVAIAIISLTKGQSNGKDN